MTSTWERSCPTPPGGLVDREDARERPPGQRGKRFHFRPHPSYVWFLQRPVMSFHRLLLLSSTPGFSPPCASLMSLAC